jgi:hypothetical protein
MLNFNKKINTKVIRPTSKVALKITCLEACDNNVEEAKKLYEFFISDMKNLPDMEPIQATRLEQARDAVNGAFGWLKENKDDIMQIWDFVNSLRNGRAAAAPPANVAPIPDNV